MDRLGGVRVEPFEVCFARAVFVVVAFHARHVRIPNQVQAFLGIGVVTDDVSKANEMGAFLGFGILQNHPKRLQIGMDIGNNRVSHFTFRQLTISKPRISPVASFQAASSFRMNGPTSEYSISRRNASSSSFVPSAVNSTRPSDRLRTTPVTSNPLASILTV